MNINKYTTKAKETIENMVAFVEAREQQAIEPMHVLLVLLEQEGGIVQALLEKLAVDVSQTREHILSEINKFPKVSGGGKCALPMRQVGRSCGE